MLDNPELLPIGVELRIPDDRMADSTRRILVDAATRLPQPSTAPRHGAGRMDAPERLSGSPRAELLQPIPAGRIGLDPGPLQHVPG